MNSKVKDVCIDVAIILAGALAIYASYHYYVMAASKFGILFGLIASFAVSVHFSKRFGKKDLEAE